MSDVGMLMVSEGEDPVTADIVFVHGLKGHREGDWTKRNVKQNGGRGSNIFWPRDLLAHEDWMKHVRVMSWGYDARIAHITQFTSKNSVHDHACNLLQDIASQRCGGNELNRPIIFVGYSLGGLIIKQALIQSNMILLNKQDPNAGAIFSSTCGVIFLGTPHRGSFLATKGNFIRKILSLVLREGNDNILQSIEVNSMFLQQQISAFSRISQKISLVCFYEELSTLVGLAVPQAFAVMDGFNVKKVAIHANHSNLCRFMGPSDNGYKRTSYQIKLLLKEVNPAANPHETPSQPINWYQKDRESKCLQVLRGSRCYERNKDRNPKRAKSTCQGILGDEKFTNWRDGESMGLLWISAIPGYGKSVLARSLVDEELFNKDKTTICYFFFKEDDENARKVTDALCACLHQLFEKHPELIKYALPFYDQNGEALSKLDNKLWDILLEIAEDRASPNLVFIIDALDESKNNEVLIEKLVQYYNHNETQGQSQRVTASRLKFLVTSRPYEHIKREFNKLAGQESENNIHLSCDGKALKKDIELVIDVELLLIQEQLRLADKVVTLIKKKLVATNNWSYLWLHLVLKDIKKSIGVTTEEEMQKLISQLPKTLTEAYEAILRRILDPRGARKLLQIIVAAARPLSVLELKYVVAIDGDTQHQPKTNPEAIETFKTKILNQCDHFITIADNTVYLIHQTAKEFLLPSHELSLIDSIHDNHWQGSIDIRKANEILSQACIRYLCFPELGDLENISSKTNTSGQDPNNDRDEKHVHNSSQETKPDESGSCESIDSVTVYHPQHWQQFNTEQRFKRHHFLEYASMHWLFHFSMSSPEDNLLQQSLRLCDVHSKLCKNWFETLPARGDCDLQFFQQLFQYTRFKTLFQGGLAQRGKDFSFCCFIGHVKGAESLLKKMKLGPQNIESQNTIRDITMTALSIAVENGRGEIVQMLLEQDPNLVNMDLTYRDDYVAQNLGDQAELTALRLAVRNHQHGLVPLLLELKADPNATGHPSILVDALNSNGPMEELSQTVKLLLEHGARINENTESGASSLYIAEACNLPGSLYCLHLDSKRETLSPSHLLDDFSFTHWSSEIRKADALDFDSLYPEIPSSRRTENKSSRTVHFDIENSAYQMIDGIFHLKRDR